MSAFEKVGMVRTKRTWLLVVGTVVAVVGLLPAIFLSTWGVTVDPTAFAGVFAYYVIVIACLATWNRTWIERSGTLGADDRGLHLDGMLVATSSLLRDGHVRRRDGATVVRLGRRFRHVEVPVADDAEGHALLEALGLDAARSVGRYWMSHGSAGGAWRFVSLQVAALFVLTLGALRFGGEPIHVTIAFFVWMLVGVPLGLNTVVTIAVGPDGVRVRRLLSRGRFVPFADLDLAESDGRNVVLRRRDGTKITLHNAPRRAWPSRAYDPVEQGYDLVERINERVRHRDANE